MPIRVSRLAVAALLALASTHALAAQAAGETDARACGLPREAGMDDAAHAVRCAEDFVRRNGYTTEPGDTTRLAGESIEFASSRKELLHDRSGSLKARAFGVCVGIPGDAMYFTVVFRHLDPRYTNARAVTMSRSFGEMRVQHRDFDASVVAARRFGCRPVHGVPQPAPTTSDPADKFRELTPP